MTRPFTSTATVSKTGWTRVVVVGVDGLGLGALGDLLPQAERQTPRAKTKRTRFMEYLVCFLLKTRALSLPRAPSHGLFTNAHVDDREDEKNVR
jgi:hypothetical protein